MTDHQPPPPISHVGLWAPLPPPIGGVGIWTEQFLAAAPQQGWRVTLLNTAPPDGPMAETSRLRLNRLRPALRAYRDLARLLSTDRPDVVHVATTLYWATARDAVVLAACRAAGVPTVLHIHASTQTIVWHRALPRLQRESVNAVFRAASCVVVLSAELETYLRSTVPGVRVARIGNLVAVPPQLVSHPVLPPKTRPRVLFVGALTPQKGVAELAEAVLALADVELCALALPGQAADPVQQQRQDQALAALRAVGRYVELPPMPRDDVLRAYHEADVFCLPSHREGLPNVLLEAMASGLACVVTPVGGIPEVVAGDLARVVPVGDVGALQAALADLLADPAARTAMAQRAQVSVLARYGADAVMAAYGRVYAEAAALTR